MMGTAPDKRPKPKPEPVKREPRYITQTLKVTRVCEPPRYVLRSNREGDKVLIVTPEGEGGWYDANEFADHVALFMQGRL